jgi:hypothetical protein
MGGVSLSGLRWNWPWGERGREVALGWAAWEDCVVEKASFAGFAQEWPGGWV